MCFLNKLHLKKHTQLKEKSLKSLPGTINHVKKWLSFIFDGITFIKLALICNSFTHSELWLIRFALILYTNNDIYLITFATTKETFQVHRQNTSSFFSFPFLCVCVNGWQKKQIFTINLNRINGKFVGRMLCKSCNSLKATFYRHFNRVVSGFGAGKATNSAKKRWNFYYSPE